MNSRAVTPAEPLESRRLLSSAVISNHVLVVTGDNGVSNNIFVVYSADRSQIIVKLNGVEKHFSSNNIIGVDLVGGDQNDLLRVSNARNQFNIRCTLIGGAGDDTLIGGDGHNLEIGGDGDDLLIGGNQDDTMVGGRGNDTLIAGTASELIYGGEGDDSIVGSTGFDIIFAGDGNDTIQAGTGRSELFGDAGDDLISVRSEDTVYSGAGNDTISGSVGSRGSLHRGEFPSISKVVGQLDPKVGRFHAAGGVRADTSKLL